MIREDKLIEIYRQSGRELFIYIYRFLGSRESAEDILHDCFVNLIEYSQKNEIREETVRALLFRTAHNLSINYLKRKKRIEFSSIDENSIPAVHDDAEKIIEQKELEQGIARFMESLDGETRSMFIMKKELGMSLEEIAAKTGKSERTVRRRLHTALEKLAKNLEKEGFVTFLTIFLSIFLYLVVQYIRGGSPL